MAKSQKIQGIWTALVTPFDSKNEIDLDAFKKLLKDQKEAGVAGVIPCGTTGETPTLSLDEKKLLIKTTLEELKGTSIGVIAGTGSNNTAVSIELSKWADESGVDGLLLVCPYYNKPTQRGLKAHFTAIADSVQCQVMLYNVPGRTVVSLTSETIAELSLHPKITALKEATANMAFASEVMDQLQKKNSELQLLSGDDATFMPFIALGGVGTVSVASNLIPRTMVAIQKAIDSGDLKKAQFLQKEFYPIFRDLFLEANPAPVKHALAWAGLGSCAVRLPLVSLLEENAKKLEATLSSCGLKKEGGTL